MKSFHIVTFGCQMNEHDSERISGILEGRGYANTPDPGSADMIILNTCSIREKAEQKFYSELGRLKELKAANPGLKIAVAGCIAQQESAGILARAPHVDLVFGPSDIARLSEMIDKHRALQQPVVETSGDPEYHRRLVGASRTDRIKAWVSIMYGCDNFCTYCVVPYLRGRERSRPAGDIVREVRDLAAGGYREVTLLGQNVNSYGKGLDAQTDFSSLLREVNDKTGIDRIRFVTSHPRDLSDGLINSMRDLPKVCEALHLPVQSGSDAVLKAMNRNYDASAYRERVEKLRSEVPGIVLSTDIIAGFPGETEKDHELTLRLLEEVKYDSIFAFKYSKRPRTAALRLPGHVADDVKERRLAEILALQKTITIEKNRQQVGTIQEILVEGRSKRGSTLTGRTRGNKVVNMEAPESVIGSVVRVTITASGVNSLTGSLCE